ncbi:MAG: response regulator [Clostridia bacterium]
MDKKLQVILCEDEPKIREDLVRKLNACAKVIGEAVDGEQGLALALKLHPDVIVTDIRMPRMDGLELAKRIRAELPDTAVVLVSGYSDFELARQAIRYSVTDYLLKPVETQALKQIMEQLYETRHGIDKTQMIKNGIGFSGTDLRRATLLCMGNIGDDVPTVNWDLLLPQVIQTDDWALLQGAMPNCFIAYGLDGQKLYALLSLKAPPVTACSGEHLPELFQLLKEQLILGESQWLIERKNQDALTKLVRVKLNDGVFQTGSAEMLRHEAETLVHYLVGMKPPQRQFESLLLFILHRLELTHPITDEEAWTAQRSLLQTAINHARDYHEAEAPFFACCDVLLGTEHVNAKNLDELLAFVDENFANDMSLEVLAQKHGYNYAYASRAFKKQTGVSFTRYVTNKRMEMAKILLCRDMSITQVAEMVGFEDVHYFCKVFKIEAGMTPGDYRKQKGGTML